MDLAGLIVGVLGLIIAVIGTSIAVREYQKRHRIEKVFKTITQAFPGDVAKIEQSSAWALNNVQQALLQAIKLPDSEIKQQVLEYLGKAMNDAGSATKLCVPLFNNMLTAQKAQFDTRIITHPQKDKLGLCAEEARNYPQDVDSAIAIKKR